MKTIAQSLPADTLDKILAQVVPSDLRNEELTQFKAYVSKMDSRQIKSLAEELQAGARVRARKIQLREQLLSRLGTDWLRKQQEVVEAELARIEVAKDTLDFNVLELEMSGSTWRLGKIANVLRLDEQADAEPLVKMIKQEQEEEAAEATGGDTLDDAQMESLFGLR